MKGFTPLVQLVASIILCVILVWSYTWYTTVEHWNRKNDYPEQIKIEFDNQCSNLTLPDIATLSDGWKTVVEDET